MLPHRLKAARLKAGLSQERLGILAGIDEATASARMNQYERGIHTPDFELTCRLASVMEIPACYFYAVEDDLAEIILEYANSRQSGI
ncbi:MULTISPECIES: helix-turn-helix transcriptional regulator [Klebsiella]|jgi:transcriptional regulator with XRE-family HTH domain|uniref:helix-turn-helix transcriptional regulator n=1 Tax=Klebsiella TaxID=570 RepID=UPI0007CD112E|nr:MULTISPECIES: helix-turn-helix transcriptional regulator [Klebsiella]ELT0797046.1 helix-turn-helix transcriptional regulator [Klebsiella quasipneumoniae]EMA8102738.1 helix-turn-helix transcriptional regulator [Klebsiella quasipneumoniae]MBC4644045.1 helix-turn-helix transcriptional regulator [Klebsiella quasipneumoniae]MBC4694603.1 helix-turn-helix transcriptional regulator [Klebsiella quasipneumoniae]MBC4721815.1 helix-turn-helix transcriptional regulator [Klebsiella quasipneumoniae]